MCVYIQIKTGRPLIRVVNMSIKFLLVYYHRHFLSWILRINTEKWVYLYLFIYFQPLIKIKGFLIL